MPKTDADINRIKEQVVKALCDKNNWTYASVPGVDEESDTAREDVNWFWGQFFMENTAKQSIDMSELRLMQQQLMEKVPHGLRPDVLPKVAASLDIMKNLLLYLGSCGHKPWRPDPLPAEKQVEYLNKVLKATQVLREMHYHPVAIFSKDFIDFTGVSTEPTILQRKMVSALGIIEESLEYLYEETKTPTSRPAQLEEVTDILFFYLEQLILGGFSLQEIEKEYVRKWNVNIERYKKSKEGDTSWDDRGKKEGL